MKTDLRRLKFRKNMVLTPKVLNDIWKDVEKLKRRVHGKKTRR